MRKVGALVFCPALGLPVTATSVGPGVGSRAVAATVGMFVGVFVFLVGGRVVAPSQASEKYLTLQH